MENFQKKIADWLTARQGKRVAFVVALLLSSSPSLAIAEQAMQQSRQQTNKFTAEIGDGVLLVAKVSSAIVWLPSSAPVSQYGFCHITLARDDKELLDREGFLATIKNGFIDINGKPVRASIESASENLEFQENEEHHHLYRFKRSGKAAIRINLGSKSFLVPIDVKDAPFAEGETKMSQLIDKLGYPQSTERIFVSWPKLETHDGVIYNPDAGAPISREHHRFDEFPDAVFCVDKGGILRRLQSNSLSGKLAEKALLNKILGIEKEIIGLADANNVPQAEMEGPSSPDKTNIQDQKVYSFRASVGDYTVRAYFISADDKKIRLKREDDGRTIEVPLSKLSRGSRSLAERLRDAKKGSF